MIDLLNLIEIFEDVQDACFGLQFENKLLSLFVVFGLLAHVHYRHLHSFGRARHDNLINNDSGSSVSVLRQHHHPLRLNHEVLHVR